MFTADDEVVNIQNDEEQVLGSFPDVLRIVRLGHLKSNVLKILCYLRMSRSRTFFEAV